jgi:hypothetical protein
VKHVVKDISSVSDLINNLRSDTNLDDTTWFRGHSDFKWTLEPSLSRSGYVDAFEAAIRLYKKFVQNSVKLIANPPEEEYEWMFYMQHYGIPTNLMDWSESPLVGLYFAVDDENRHTEDGSLYLLEPNSFNSSASHTRVGAKDIFAFGIDDETTQYLLTQISRTNKQARQPPIAVIGPKNSARIQAQEGVFVAHHRDLRWMEDNFDASTWGWKYRIPAECKKGILGELKYLMMDRFTIYPQLDNLAKKIKDTVK